MGNGSAHTYPKSLGYESSSNRQSRRGPDSLQAGRSKVRENSASTEGGGALAMSPLCEPERGKGPTRFLELALIPRLM